MPRDRRYLVESIVEDKAQMGKQRLFAHTENKKGHHDIEIGERQNPCRPLYDEFGDRGGAKSADNQISRKGKEETHPHRTSRPIQLKSLRSKGKKVAGQDEADADRAQPIERRNALPADLSDGSSEPVHGLNASNLGNESRPIGVQPSGNLGVAAKIVFQSVHRRSPLQVVREVRLVMGKLNALWISWLPPKIGETDET